MTTQNKSNHRRLFPPFHFVLLPIILVIIVFFTFELLVKPSNGEEAFPYIINLALSICLLISSFLARVFGLKAQDRAILAEESLRHYILSGKAINPKLRLGQIIALRFASDEELIELSEKAVAENLTQNQIKSLIKNWKADFHRV
jgi:Family of unknown function (DUF6526)